MERLEYDRYGGPELVHISEFSLPPLAADEVQVRVAAASINPVDWKVRKGEMKILTGSTFPRAMGTDFSGTVLAVGANVSQFKAGDNVLGTTSMKASGAFAQELITAQKWVVKKPDNLTFIQAACLPIAGITAWLALLKKGALKRGQKVLINGAAGAVGQAAVAIAKAIGAEVVGRVGPKSLANSELLGLTTALDYTQPLPATLNGSFDVVFDCHGSLSVKQEDLLLKRGGKIIDIVPSAEKIIRAIFWSSHEFLFANPKAENLQAVVDLASAGNLTIAISKEIILADAPAVLTALENGESHSGKVVILF